MAVGRGSEEAGGSGNPRRPNDEGVPDRTVVALARAKKEARDQLTEEQYWELVCLVYRLRDFGNRDAIQDLDIRQLGEYWELRIKGGFIRNINLRVYFAFVEDRNEIVVLMTYKKEEDRRVSPHIIIILEDRLEDYLLGSTEGVSTYPRRNAQS
jgi:hypothetical protein